MFFVYLYSPPLRTWCTLLIVFQTLYLSIQSDVHVCLTLGLYLTVPLSFHLVTGDHFVLAVYCNNNASSVVFSNNNVLLPFCECTILAYWYLHNDSVCHLFLSAAYSQVIFSTCPSTKLPVFSPLIDSHHSNLRHISEWPQSFELFEKLS